MVIQAQIDIDIDVALLETRSSHDLNLCSSLFTLDVISACLLQHGEKINYCYPFWPWVLDKNSGFCRLLQLGGKIADRQIFFIQFSLFTKNVQSPVSLKTVGKTVCSKPAFSDSNLYPNSFFSGPHYHPSVIVCLPFFHCFSLPCDTSACVVCLSHTIRDQNSSTKQLEPFSLGHMIELLLSFSMCLCYGC